MTCSCQTCECDTLRAENKALEAKVDALERFPFTTLKLRIEQLEQELEGLRK